MLSSGENRAAPSSLQGITEALNVLLRGAIEKRVFLENLDLVLLTIDEAVDGG